MADPQIRNSFRRPSSSPPAETPKYHGSLRPSGQYGVESRAPRASSMYPTAPFRYFQHLSCEQNVNLLCRIRSGRIWDTSSPSQISHLWRLLGSPPYPTWVSKTKIKTEKKNSLQSAFIYEAPLLQIAYGKLRCEWAHISSPHWTDEKIKIQRDQVLRSGAHSWGRSPELCDTKTRAFGYLVPRCTQ